MGMELFQKRFNQAKKEVGNNTDKLFHYFLENNWWCDDIKGFRRRLFYFYSFNKREKSKTNQRKIYYYIPSEDELFSPLGISMGSLKPFDKVLISLKFKTPTAKTKFLCEITDLSGHFLGVVDSNSLFPKKIKQSQLFIVKKRIEKIKAAAKTSKN